MDINQVDQLFIAQNVDIKEILITTYEERQILEWHNKYKRFNQKKRKRLAHFIISGILKDCKR